MFWGDRSAESKCDGGDEMEWQGKLETSKIVPTQTQKTPMVKTVNKQTNDEKKNDVVVRNDGPRWDKKVGYPLHCWSHRQKSETAKGHKVLALEWWITSSFWSFGFTLKNYSHVENKKGGNLITIWRLNFSLNKLILIWLDKHTFKQ